MTADRGRIDQSGSAVEVLFSPGESGGQPGVNKGPGGRDRRIIVHSAGCRRWIHGFEDQAIRQDTRTPATAHSMREKDKPCS